jgi:4-amino-4-deoxy-L-arabinose transferase-like glycosyltransferase
MASKDNIKKYLLLGWMVLAAAYLFLIIPRIDKPILGWEALVWEIPRRIAACGYTAVRFFYLPPLYDSLMAISFKSFGVSEASARIPGVLCFLAMPAILYLLAKELTEDDERLPVFLIACTIYFTAPLAIQGSLLIDRSDTTLLTLALTLFYLSLLKMEDRFSIHGVILAGVLYAVCLWTKVTTPLACLAAVPLAHVVCRRFDKRCAVSIGALLLGTALFIATWGTFCYFVIGMKRFAEPFGYYGIAASDTVLAVRGRLFSRIALDLFRIYLWFSPFLLMAGVLAFIEVGRRIIKKGASCIKEAELAAFVAVVFAGYLYANATFSGFPKYVTPVLPILSLLAAHFIWRTAADAFNRKTFRAIAILACAAIGYYIFIVKDWIYAVYLLRQAQSVGLVASDFQRLAWQQALYLLCPVAMFILSFCLFAAPLFRRSAVILFASLLANNIALDMMQRQAPYSVNFAYGARGAEGLRDFLRSRQPADVFSSIEGYIANAGDVNFHGVNADVWDAPKKFLALMKEYKPGCLIYGLAANTASQLKGTLNDPAVRAHLDSSYDRFGIGSYDIAIRRGC